MKLKFFKSPLLTAVLCSTAVSLIQNQASAEVRTISRGSIDFSAVNAKIFKPQCATCHSGSVQPSLVDYASIKANLDRIHQQALVLKRMPKGGPLASDDQALLQAWIDDGAPETVPAPAPVALPSLLPAPSPSLAPTLPPAPEATVERPWVTYSMVREQVFKKSCLPCHFAGNTQSISSFEELETIKGTVPTIFFVAVIGSVMPPPPPGLPDGSPNPNQLSRAQKDVLAHWIVDGLN